MGRKIDLFWRSVIIIWLSLSKTDHLPSFTCPLLLLLTFFLSLHLSLSLIFQTLFKKLDGYIINEASQSKQLSSSLPAPPLGFEFPQDLCPECIKWNHPSVPMTSVTLSDNVRRSQRTQYPLLVFKRIKRVAEMIARSGDHQKKIPPDPFSSSFFFSSWYYSQP